MTYSTLPPSITAANWIKKSEHQAPNQSCANIKLTCATPQISNTLLTECLYIVASLVKAYKDLKEPMCCNNCQEYSHLWDDCTNEEQCTTCTGSYSTNLYSNPNHPKCISCGTDSKYPSLATAQSSYVDLMHSTSTIPICHTSPSRDNDGHGPLPHPSSTTNPTPIRMATIINNQGTKTTAGRLWIRDRPCSMGHTSVNILMSINSQQLPLPPKPHTM